MFIIEVIYYYNYNLFIILLRKFKYKYLLVLCEKYENIVSENCFQLLPQITITNNNHH